ncbi:MAG: Gfo/Idh/MocA family oxidoreductase [Verrucomicrobia bacterium]|nr:Gfo/Idh/MocA family oxidoreductase [Verrucomicrobiota bacterium]
MRNNAPAPAGYAPHLTRRNFFNRCGAGLGGIALASLPGAGRLFGAETRPAKTPLRLGVSGGEAMWRGVAPRMRGATLGMFFRDPAAFDAMLFVDAGRLEAGLVGRCLSANKPVMLVADSWLSADVLKALSATAQQTKTQLAVANPERFLPSRQLIRQHLESGKLGEPGLVRLHRWEPAPANRRSAAPEWPTSLLRDLELALSLMGRSPNSIYGLQRLANERDTSAGRSVLVHLGFPGGGMATIDYADRLPPGDDYVSLTVVGSSGATYADDHQNMQLVYRGGRPQSVRTEERGRQLAAMAQGFVDDLKANRDFSPTVAAWAGALAVADSVRRSFASRQAINLEVL